MRVDVLEADRISALDDLIARFPYNPYRHYRILSGRRRANVLRAMIQQPVEDGTGTVYIAGSINPADPRAACLLRELPWETEFFGLPMARVESVVRSDAEPEAMRELLRAVVARARDEGVAHLAARVDIADCRTVHALEDLGFRLMDTLVTYIYRHKEQPPQDVRNMGTLRSYDPADRDQLLAIAAEAYSGFRGRYHNDPHIADERATAMYVEWARLCVDGDWAEHVLVTEDGGGILHGFATFRCIEPVSTVGGVGVHGGGLGGCRRDRPGAYMGLLQGATKWIYGQGAVTECQTQSVNFPTIRLYEALGQRFVRAEHTFHAWLGTTAC